jgi:hypothetical protein
MIVILAVASLAPLWAAYVHNGFLNDDVFITLNFVKNLVEGRGFVYNHPPAIQGTTTPLLALTVAGLKVLAPRVEIPRLDIYLTAFCWLGVVWTFFIFRKYWGLSDWQSTVLGLVLIASGSIVFLGMEVYLYFFLLVLCTSLYYAQKYYWSGIVTGLLFLARGEGVLVLVTLILFALLSAWRVYRADLGRSNITQSQSTSLISIRLVKLALKPVFQLIVGFAIPVVVWFIYAQFAFGSLLPSTLAAKRAQGAAGRTLPLASRLIYDWAPSWGKNFTFFTISFLNWWWLFVIAGLLAAIFRKRKWLIFLLWIVLYIAGYTLLGVAAYWWYQIPILFMAQVFLALGILEGISTITRAVSTVSFRKAPLVAAGLSITLVIWVVFALGKQSLNGIATYTGDIRGESYTRLGQWFRENTRPTDSLAFVEIGYLGYYTDNRIIDLEGLILPDILPHIVQKDLAWGFWHYQPDYFVYLPDFDWVLSSIQSDPRFGQMYTPVAQLPGPQQTDFIIYRRLKS